MSGDRKPEAGLHSRAVAFHRRVEERLEAGKRHDVVEPGRDIGLRHPHDGALQEHVLAPREIGVKPRGHLDERTHASTHAAAASGGLHDSRQQLQRSRFAGAVRADDADGLAPRDLEAHVAKRPEFLIVELVIDGPSEQSSNSGGDQVTQRIVTLAAPELLPDAVEGDDRIRHHTFSANWNSARWNISHAANRTANEKAVTAIIGMAAGHSPNSSTDLYAS